ncbi:hypothetical protein Dsin_004492 [Dipteronia sinensis]|uniref:Uncharacterized protein n=1 Tax=Dipteronia sinensis TaxID=43782 RepID=A0AAE0AVJ7_9ROSI|nr:hypothetical protein Dsin_004492 [Dipteronia sinensis]
MRSSRRGKSQRIPEKFARSFLRIPTSSENKQQTSVTSASSLVRDHRATKKSQRSPEDSIKRHLRDLWIPKPSSFQVVSPYVFGGMTTFSLLLNPSEGWNVPIVHASFYREDAKAILSLPTGSSRTVGSLMWQYEKSGVYMVRIGYKVGRNLIDHAGSSGLC